MYLKRSLFIAALFIATAMSGVSVHAAPNDNNVIYQCDANNSYTVHANAVGKLYVDRNDGHKIPIMSAYRQDYPKEGAFTTTAIFGEVNSKEKIVLIQSYDLETGIRDPSVTLAYIDALGNEAAIHDECYSVR